MGLKDRLSARRRPTATYGLRIDDDTVARAELGAARAAGDEARIVAAQEAVEACYEQVTLTALPPAELEALIAAHPPPKESQVQKAWNPVTFIPALLAASVDSDVTEDDWAEYHRSGAMTTGEIADLFNAVWELNYRAPDPNVKKD
jgi:hypothetical protein